MKKTVKLVFTILGILFLIWFVKYGCENARGNIYAPTDLKQFQVATYDTGYYPTLTDADSVQFYFRYNGNSYYDTSVTASVITGVFNRETSVCKWWYDSTGSWGYYARAYYKLQTGAKTWDWMVKWDPLESERSVEQSGGNLSTKRLYVSSHGNGGNNGLSRSAPVCSLRTAEALCTGADEYFIYVDAGSYTSQSCTINVDNVHLVGAGRDVCKLSGTGTVPIIIIDGVDGVEITGFYFSGTAGGGSAVYPKENNERFSVHHCRFNDVSSGIYMGASSNKNAEIYDNIMVDAGVDAIYVNGIGHWIYHNYIDSLASSGADGIAPAATSNHCFIIENYVKSTVGDPFDALGDWSANMIAGNYFHAEQGTAIDGADVDTLNAYVGNRIESKIGARYTVEEDIYAVYANADSAMDEVRNLDGDDLDGVVRYTMPDSILQLRGLHVIAEENSDDTAIIVISGGLANGIGIFAQGAVVGGMGIKTVGEDGIYAQGINYGIYAKATGTDKVGILGVATGTGGIGIRGLKGSGGYDILGDIHGKIDEVSFAGQCTTLVNDALLDTIMDEVRNLEKFLGANDGYYQKLYPLGSANKDSVEIYDSGDNLLGTLYYFHTDAIIDSVRWEKW